jgi:hypothetical protein
MFKLKIFAGRPLVPCSVVNVFNLRPIDGLDLSMNVSAVSMFAASNPA